MSRFKDLEAFSSRGDDPYKLLPLRFSKLDDADNYVVSNLVGEFLVLARSVVVALIR